ncbi:MAG: winged helix-turn-helix domain-containing protein [Thermoleophilia bacterium]|nr:winged helix-turn-helix domain-containing protein [Thermoleophilia bacterium]
MEQDGVNEAFDILLEEIEAVATDLNEVGAEAFKAGDYDRARATIEEAARLSEFREKVRQLQKVWKSFGEVQRKRSSARAHRKSPAARVARGLRTPEEAFRRPVLESLVELGGCARSADVLDLVYRKVQGVLNEYDCQPLPSEPNCPRWRNTAQWCRYTLVREGLMKADSPHGIWEITEEGRREVEQT